MKKKKSDVLFASPTLFRIWAVLCGTVFSAGLFLRLWDLRNPLLEPHPIRQTQTALTAVLFAEGRTQFLDYRSPYDGQLWNFVHEFPLYQWLVSLPMRAGIPVEVSARLFTLFFFAMGFYFVLRLARRFLSVDFLPWIALAYFASPFLVIFSRTCLVDFMALAFLLASFEVAFAALARKAPAFYLLATLSCVLGSLAAVCKTNLWFSPITFFCCYFLWQGWKKKVPRSQAAWMVGQALVQLCVAIIWIRWTMSIRGMQGTVVGDDTAAWILGAPALRLQSQPWLKILNYWVRSLWHDWMLVPALAAFFSPYRRLAAICLGISLFSIFTTFNVHSFHDYYLIGESPYLLLWVGIGLTFLIQRSVQRGAGKARTDQRRVAIAALSLTVAIFATRIPKIPYYFAPVFTDYREGLTRILPMKELTDRRDLIVWESETEAWQKPLYSERDVILSPYYHKGLGSRPTVYRTEGSLDLAHLIDEESEFWLDGADGVYGIVRVAERGRFVQDPAWHIWFGGEPDPRPTQMAVAGPNSQWSTCKQDQWLELKRTQFPAGTVTLTAGDKAFTLPWKPFVHLPAQSAFGCHFHIGSELRRAASNRTEM